MSLLISIVIPTYNRKELTDRAIKSVASFYPELLEIIVVDDCGSIPYSYHDELNESGIIVNVVRLPLNVGAGMARKVGVDKSNGEYVAFLDSDDYYDKGWIDFVLKFLQTDPEALKNRVFISGISKGGKRSATIIKKLLTNIPQGLQLFASRLVAIMFNPFYTPSIVMSREMCFFMNGLRHCEDYYSTAFALFQANRIILPQVVACHLGRAPNSLGGESASREKMFRGEMKVRFALFKEVSVPLGYKLILPIGVAYQWIRSFFKTMFS